MGNEKEKNCPGNSFGYHTGQPEKFCDKYNDKDNHKGDVLRVGIKMIVR